MFLYGDGVWGYVLLFNTFYKNALIFRFSKKCDRDGVWCEAEIIDCIIQSDIVTGDA